MTVRFRLVPDFDRLPETIAKNILYQELLPACEAQGIKLAPEGHVPEGTRYEDTKRDQSALDVHRVQRAFAAVDFIYRRGTKYQDVCKPLFEQHPQGGYVGGGELMAAMILKGYPAKFGEDGEILGLRALFPVERACSGNHRSRLFVGEAGFNGVAAIVEKHKNTHPNLGSSIVATELRTLENFPQRRDFLERLDSLQECGVTIGLGVDGTKIHEDPLTRGKIFERIHWNCPHDGSSYTEQTLPPIIERFFSSAKNAQLDGHQIHITLAQPIEGWDKSPFYQGVVYNIHNAAQSNGYNLYAKRAFGPERYPGYTHEQTRRADSATGANRLREFVFIKGPLPADRNSSECRSQFFRAVSERRRYYVCDTDNESSSYSRSRSPGSD